MYIKDRKEPMRLDFWRYWVFNDPRWDWRMFDFDRDVAYADQKLAAVNASSADLSKFRSLGGKILMYSGWADPTGPPMDAVNYYKRVSNKRRVDGKTQSRSLGYLWFPEWHTVAADRGQISSADMGRPLQFRRRSNSIPSTMC